jgi:hypothetical protein
MKIEKAYFADGAFLVVTTGARYEYVPGELKIYQGIGRDDSRRLLSTVKIEGDPKFERVESSDDHVLLWSEKLNIGIYGDSTCIVAPRESLNISFAGNFKPDYEGRYNGELLLIDDFGGMEIYPQRYEAGYNVNKIELGKKNWVATYRLNASERLMIAAFPGRPFDWERSFKSDIISTYGSMGRGVGNLYGEMPPDDKIKEWASYFGTLVLWYNGLYGSVSAGPYTVVNEPEFHRLVRTAKRVGLRVAPYTSVFYHYRKFKSIESYFEQIKALRDKYGIDGVYIDGLLCDYQLEKNDDKITNWEIIRRLRQLFGKEGVLIFHCTHLGTPVATIPNVDTYCDVTFAGEGVAFKSVDDPYVRYQVRKYGISNTVAMWIPGKQHPADITYRDIIDAVVEMNGRGRGWGFVAVDEPPKHNKYVWGNGLTKEYKYYLKKIEPLKEAYYKNKE